MTKPLWSDQKIVAAAKINRSESDVVHMLFGMRDSYEQRISDLHDEYEGRHYKTCMYYVKFIDQIGNEKENLRRENERLRAVLPDAERVPADLITPPALEAGGWYAKEYGNGCIAYMKAGVIVHDDPTLTSLLVTWQGREIPYCRTMQQLTALVEILGGEK